MKQEFQTDFLEDKEESDQVNLSLGVFAHRTLTLTLYQKAVLFPPNGKMLVTAGVDGAVRLWDCTLLLSSWWRVGASPGLMQRQLFRANAEGEGCASASFAQGNRVDAHLSRWTLGMLPPSTGLFQLCAWLKLRGYSVLQLATVTGQPGDVCRIWQLPKDGKPKELQTITPPGTWW